MARLSSYSLLTLATLLSLQSCGPPEKPGRAQMLEDVDHSPTAEDKGLSETKTPLPLPGEPVPTMTKDGPAALMLEDAGEEQRPAVPTEPQRLEEPGSAARAPK